MAALVDPIAAVAFADEADEAPVEIDPPEPIAVKVSF